MFTPSWIRKVSRESKRRHRQALRRRRRETLNPFLSATILEERRVLSAAPAMELAQALAIDAGVDANDGTPDVFQVSVVEQDGQERLEVSVNDRLSFVGPLSDQTTLSIAGSSDNDFVSVEFSGDAPFTLDTLSIDGGQGGFDQLTLSGATADSVLHNLTGPNCGQIVLGGDGSSTSIGYTGIESISDLTTADQRIFQLGGESSSIVISDDAQTGNGISLLDPGTGAITQFVAPDRQLEVKTDATTSERIELRGLDSEFDADFTLTAQNDDSVHVTGDVSLGTGDLSLIAGEISHEGTISAPGGTVHLDAGDGVLSVTGTIDVSDATPGHTGGTVHLLGQQVGLYAGAMVDASGNAGGGEILIGGDYQGGNPIFHNSRWANVGSDVLINANATERGDGGKVIVWSDDMTRFHGEINVQGGQHGGDGGFVEVSGKDRLVYRGTVNALAPSGKAGTLLLDPKNATVDNSGSATPLTDADQFADSPAGNVTIDRDTINAAAANVVVQANNDITVAAGGAINMANAGVSLTMQAGRSILINANISTNDGAINLTANETVANGVIDANRDAGNAVITMAGGVTLDAGNQDITITLSTGASLTNSDSGDITLETLTTDGNVVVVNNGPSAGSEIVVQGNLSAGATGAVALTAKDGLTINNATVQANNGTITLNADGDADNVGDFVTMGAAPQVLATTNDNQISIVAADVTLGANTLIDNDNGTSALRPSNTNRTIGLGGVAGTSFAINDTEIDYFGTGVDTPTINVGQNHNAAVTVDGLSPTRAITLVIDADGGSSGSVAFSNNPTAFVANGSLQIDVADGGVSIGQPLTLSGTGGLDIDASGGTVAINAAVAAGSGGVVVDPPATLNVNSNIITAGNIDLQATDNVNIDATVQTTGAATTVEITANAGTADNMGDLTIGGTSAATVQAVGGNITLTGEGVVIGNAGNLVTVQTTAAGGIDINADANDDAAATETVTLGASLNTFSTVSGDIKIDNAVNVTVANAAAAIASGAQFFAGGAGDITGTVDIDRSITSATSMTINADGGITIDNATLTTTNGVLTLDADNDQDGTGDLSIGSTTAATLNSSGGGQDIRLYGESIAVATGANVSVNAGAGDLELHANLDDNATGSIRMDEARIALAVQDFTISATDAPVTLVVSDTEAANTISATDLSSASGAVTLRADDDVNVNDSFTINGSVTIAADADGSGGGGGALTMSDGVVVDAGGGTISLSADEDVTVSRLVTTNATVTAVSLTSASGGVVDGGDTGGVDVQATTGRLVASVVTGVGASGVNGALETNVASLQTSGSGNIDVTESNAIDLAGVTTTSGSINVSAGGAITASSVSTTGGTNTDGITLSGSSIEVDTISAAGAGDVSLTATTGDIDDADANSTVTADDLSFSAVTDVGGTNAIGTTVAEVVSGTSTGAGVIALNEIGGVVLTSLSNANGSISVTAGGAITAGNVATTGGADTDDITLNGTSIEVDTISAAGAADVSLTATTGDIDDADANSTITADDLSFIAVTDVGGTNAIGTTVAEVLSGTSTGAGVIALNETGGLVLTSLSNANGSISVTAAGAITAANVATTGGADTDDITLNGTSIEVDTISAAGAADVSLTATTGDIDDADANSTITADDLSFIAVTDVGGTNAIGTTVAEVLSGTSTGAGVIALNETGGLVLTSLSNANGSISVTAGGAITAGNVAATGGAGTDDITLSGTSIEVDTINAAGAGDVSLTATAGDIDDVDANSTITADDLSFSAATDVGGTNAIGTTISEVLNGTSTGAGVIALNETTGVVLTTLSNANGSISMTAGGAITAGNVATTGGADTDDITLNGTSIEVDTISAAGAGDVSLTATAGDIDDADANSTVTADDLSFSAATDVGGTNAIGTTVAEVLSGTSTGAGAIALNETTAVVLTSLSNSNGLISVTAGGAITAGNVATTGGADTDEVTLNGPSIEVNTISAAGAGDVSLTATTGDIDDVDANSTITADDLSFSAATAVGGTNAIGTTVAEVLNGTSSGAGAIALNETTGVVLTSLSNANGSISVTAGGAITAGNVSTTGGADTDDITLNGTAIEVDTISAAGAADVSLTATTGDIDDADANSTITADDLSFSAATDVGGSNAIGTTVAQVLSGTSTGAGNIALNETTGVMLTSLSNSNGSISVSAGGTVTAGLVTAGASNVDINVANGSLLSAASDATADIVGGTVTLNVTGAGNTIGISTAVLDVDATTLNASTNGAAADDIFIDDEAGGVAIDVVNAGAGGDVFLTAVGGAMTDANVASNNITAADLVLRAASGIGQTADELETTVNRLEADGGTGGVFITNTGALTIGGISGVTGVSATSGDIRVTASSPLTVDEDVIESGGDDITLTATNDGGNDDDLTINALVQASGGSGSIILNAGTDLIVMGGIGVDEVSVVGAGTITANVGRETQLNANADVVSAGGTITFNTDEMVINTGSATVDSAAGRTIIQPTTGGGTVAIDLGSNPGTGNVLELSDAELDRITAGTLEIGDSTAGAVSFTAPLTPGGTTTLHVLSGSTVSQTGGSTITETDLAITATQAVTLTEANDVDSLAVALQDSGQNLTFFDVDDLRVDTVDAVVGVTLIDAADSNGGGQITIRSGGALTVNQAVANHDGGNTTLASEGNALTDDLDINANIMATGGSGNINLYAGDSIDIDPSVTISAAGSGAVLASAGTDFNNGAPLDGNPAGDVAMGDGSAIRSEDGNLTIRAPDDIQLSIVDANSDSDATVGDVIVTADYAGPDTTLGSPYASDNDGAISDNLATENANVTGDELVMRAGSGIGDGEASNTTDIDTEVNVLAAVTDSGDIHVQNSGALTISTFDSLSGVTIIDSANDNSGADHVTIRSTGPLTVDTGDPVVNNDGGNITLAAEGSAAADDLTVNANVTTADGTGNVRLYAGDTIDLAAGAVIVSAVGSGDVLLSAGTDFNDNTIPLRDGNSEGDVLMTSGAAVNAEDGNITLLAPDDIQLSIINANSDIDATVGHVIVTADYAGPDSTGASRYASNDDGAISDTLAGENANVTGDELAMRAGTGIGDGEASNTADIDTAINVLAAVTDSGDIHVQNSGELTVDTFNGLSGVTITDAADDNSGGDHITIRATSPLTIDAADPVVNNDGGNVTLAAEGNAATDDLTINANVTSAGGSGNVSLYAGDTVDLALATVVVSTTGNGGVLLSAGTDFNDNSSPLADGNSEGDVLMTSGAAVSSEDGNITLLAPDNVQLSTVNANSNSDATLGDVIVTADYAGPDGTGSSLYDSNNDGAISDNSAAETANITGDETALRAGTGIGDGEASNAADIDMAVNVLAAMTDSGDIHLQNGGALTIDTFDGLSGVTIADAGDDNSGADHVTIRATSPLTSAAGNPVVNSDGGNITMAAEGNTAADDLTLNDNITAIGGNGNINLYAGDTINLALSAVVVSAVGNGEVLLSAGTDFNDAAPQNGNASGDIVMQDGSTISTEDDDVDADGDIMLRAPGNVQVSVLNANSDGDATLGDVFVTADYNGASGGLSDNNGAISDNLSAGIVAGGEAVNITSDETVLRAGTGVADDSEDLDTQVATLAGVTHTGDFNVEDAAGGLTIATVDGTSGVTIANGGAADNILLSAVVGDLTINASVTTTGNGTITGRAGGNLQLNAAAAVVIETATGRISTITPTVTITPHQFRPNEEVDVGNIVSTATMDQLIVGDVQGTNYRVDTDWGVSGDPSQNLVYQVVDIVTGELAPSAVPTSQIDATTVHTVTHEYPTIALQLRPDTSADIFAVFTFSFDYRGGTPGDDFVSNGIQLFEDTTQPVVVRVTVAETVRLRLPNVGAPQFLQTPREEAKVEVSVPETRTISKTSSTETPGFELISPLPGAAIDPQDHLELFRVAVEDEEIPVKRWDDGDASALDDLPRLFGGLDNDHYRLYLMRDGEKLERYFDVLVKDGIPLPPPVTAQSQAADAAQNVLADGPSDNVDSEAKADDANSGELSLRPADLSVGQDHPIVAPDVSNVSNQHEPGNEQTVAVAVGAAALVSGFQRSWETRVDRAMKNLGNRSLNKISRLCRRSKRSE